MKNEKRENVQIIQCVMCGNMQPFGSTVQSLLEETGLDINAKAKNKTPKSGDICTNCAGDIRGIVADVMLRKMEAYDQGQDPKKIQALLDQRQVLNKLFQ